MPSNVDICVATYKRPALLANLLASLALQSIRGSTVLRIIVVDNDVAQSAERTVGEFRADCGMEVVYDVEAKQGISYTRNRALSHVTAPLIAFIDDDEVASPRWLEALLDAMDHYQADVVFGPVNALLPDSAPTWAKTHPSFRRPRVATGSVLTHGATNNVVFRTLMVANLRKPFDERFALTGGEDTEFFARMNSGGYRLIWCDEADVSEYAPPERLTIRWVCKRAFRGGQTYFRIFIATKPVVARVLWLAIRLFAVLMAPLWLPIVALRGTNALVLYLTRASGWLGQLSQTFGRRFEYEEYQGNRVSE